MKICVTFELNGNENDCIELPGFYPNDANTPWSSVEIHPVVEIERGIYEVNEEGKEAFWSVYLHQINGGLKCVADVSSKKEAELLAELIRRSSNTRIHCG